jgi:putative hydrolase of the HAD superfamily
MTTSALLIDLDGVLRVWEPSVTAVVEQKYGLPAGAINRVAFSPERLAPAISGKVSDAEWRGYLADDMAVRYGPSTRAAIVEWSSSCGAVNDHVRRLVAAERGRRLIVLVTNATSRLATDLEVLGLTDDFDAVCNSSVVGVAKPDPQILLMACELVGASPLTSLFVDDSHSNVEAAAALGMTSHHYRDPDALAEFFAQHQQ